MNFYIFNGMLHHKMSYSYFSNPTIYNYLQQFTDIKKDEIITNLLLDKINQTSLTIKLLRGDNKDDDDIGEIFDDPRGFCLLTQDEKDDINNCNNYIYDKKPYLNSTILGKTKQVLISHSSRDLCALFIFIYRTNAHILNSNKYRATVKRKLIELKNTITIQDIRWVEPMYDLMFPGA